MNRSWLEHRAKASRSGSLSPSPREPPSPALPPFGARFLYDTARFGLGNGGHTFGDRFDDVDRMAIIEYLKTF